MDTIASVLLQHKVSVWWLFVVKLKSLISQTMTNVSVTGVAACTCNGLESVRMLTGNVQVPTFVAVQMATSSLWMGKRALVSMAEVPGLC